MIERHVTQLRITKRQKKFKKKEECFANGRIKAKLSHSLDASKSLQNCYLLSNNKEEKLIQKYQTEGCICEINLRVIFNENVS